MPPSPRPIGVSVTAPSRARKRLHRLLQLCAYGYLLCLVVGAVALYVVGESWWVTAAALYVPRVALAAPLPFIVGGLWFIGPRRLLWSQAAAAFVVVVPLMGFVLPWPSFRSSEPTFRILSFNVDSAYAGVPQVLAQVNAFSPDVVLLEETPGDGPLTEGLRARYPFVQASTQFIIASRFRIESSTDPEKIPFYGRARSPRYMRYQLASPFGSVVVYCVHPLSPRGVLHLHRFRGALHELRTGQLLAGDPEAEVQSNASLRALQVEAAGKDAAAEKLPVVIAGDTNLPGLSAAYRQWLARFRDGFSAASWGFGYTFPTKRPFLRLDRILVSEDLGFTSFQSGCKGVSDHLCVVADIQARK